MPILPLVETPMEDIDHIYRRLQARFASHVTLSLDYRIYNLKQLAYLIQDNQTAIQEAVKADLDKGPLDVLLSDLWPVVGEIALAIKRLPKWMKDENRAGDALWSFRTITAKVKKQPKGVSLIIAPWNYPWHLCLSPLVAAIAAGCPAIVKPSELAPSSSALFASLLPKYLDPEAYAVVIGGPSHSSKLLEKQWGHILFTGSGRVGKIVAEAAAKTLTPTTLELGGKSPVIVSPCADIKILTTRLFSIKALGAGQMCVSPDYILCPKNRIDELVASCRSTLDKFFPHSPSPQSLLHTTETAAIRSDRELDRLVALIDRADAEGKLIYRGELDKKTRRIGIHVVLLNENGKEEKGGLVEEEIFGLVVPIIPIEDVDAAIAYVNARPHPLALYVCSRKHEVFKKVARETTSGSITWNDFGFATISRQLPFGGVGDSGWGAYHGRDGFNTFTHHKAVLEIPYYLEPIMSSRYPPFAKLSVRLNNMMLNSGVPFARPTSVEDEERRRKRGRLLNWLILLLGVSGVFGAAWRGLTRGKA